MDQCKVVVITNQKAGVEKTTTTVNLGVGLANMGKVKPDEDMDQLVQGVKERGLINLHPVAAPQNGGK